MIIYWNPEIKFINITFGSRIMNHDISGRIGADLNFSDAEPSIYLYAGF